MTAYVLAIGVNNYLYQSSNLKYAVSDAERFGLLMEIRWGFDVTVLTDASGMQLWTALCNLAEKVEKGDEVLLFFAGHGIETGEHGFKFLLCEHNGDKRTFESFEAGLKAGEFSMDLFSHYSGTDERWEGVGFLEFYDTCRVGEYTGARGIVPGERKAKNRHCRIFSCEKGREAWEHEGLVGGMLTHALLMQFGGAQDLGLHYNDKSFANRLTATLPPKVRQLGSGSGEFKPDLMWLGPKSSVRLSKEVVAVDRVLKAHVAANEGYTPSEVMARFSHSPGDVLEAINQIHRERKRNNGREGQPPQGNGATSTPSKPNSNHSQSRSQLALPHIEAVHALGADFGMIRIAPGDYWVANGAGDLTGMYTLSAWLACATTPITVEQWEMIMGPLRRNLSEQERRRFLTCSDKLPMTGMLYDDACKFCKILTGKVNKMRIKRGLPRLEEYNEYRLPNEAEWELMARAGGKKEFNFLMEGKGKGRVIVDAADVTESILNFNCEKYIDSKPGPIPVHKSGRNIWGVFGCHGNTEEFVDFSPFDRNREERNIIMKGGFFGSFKDEISCSARRLRERKSWRMLGVTGFRIVRTLNKSELEDE